MSPCENSKGKRPNDLGVSILIVSVGMIFVLGMAGLGVDLASLYVARSQAQRTADAAALAGATYWAKHGCASATGTDITPNCKDNAKVRAQKAGEANLVAGAIPGLDISFPTLSVSDPQIRVVAARDTAHDNPVPTFFVKVFGIDTVNISASATAEAYNATNNSTLVGSKCVKPWLLPDCDPNTASTDGNPYCLDQHGNINGGHYASDPNLVGSLITIKPGNPGQASGPSEFYPVFVQGDQASASSCPTCASSQNSSGSQSGDLYRQNIECCIQNPVVCGTQTITAINGNMVGPTDQGVQCLIGQLNSGSGQDIYDPTTGTITAGSNNYYKLTGQISDSDSIITIPVYNGQVICPGGSTTGSPSLCNSSAQVKVTGFLQVFVKDVGAPSATVYAYVLAYVDCSGGSNGEGTGQPIVASGGSAIPVRLIQ